MYVWREKAHINIFRRTTSSRHVHPEKTPQQTRKQLLGLQEFVLRNAGKAFSAYSPHMFGALACPGVTTATCPGNV